MSPFAKLNYIFRIFEYSILFRGVSCFFFKGIDFFFVPIVTY